jgi:hypothetical protein
LGASAHRLGDHGAGQLPHFQNQFAEDIFLAGEVDIERPERRFGVTGYVGDRGRGKSLGADHHLGGAQDLLAPLDTSLGSGIRVRCHKT